MKKDDDNNEPRIVRRNGSEISTHVGIYHHSITVELALRHRSRLVTVEEIAKVQFGRATLPFIHFVRSKLWYDVNLLIDRDELAIMKYEDAGYRRIVGLKLFNPKTDKSMFSIWFERYTKRRNQTISKIEKVEKLHALLDGNN